MQLHKKNAIMLVKNTAFMNKSKSVMNQMNVEIDNIAFMQPRVDANKNMIGPGVAAKFNKSKRELVSSKNKFLPIYTRGDTEAPGFYVQKKNTDPLEACNNALKQFKQSKSNINKCINMKG